VDFCYFTQAFCHKKFWGARSCVEMLKRDVIGEWLGTPAAERPFRINKAL